MVLLAEFLRRTFFLLTENPVEVREVIESRAVAHLGNGVG